MEEKEFIDYVYDMHLQNTNGRETPDEMFRLGIEAAYEEREHLTSQKEEGVPRCSECKGTNVEVSGLFQICNDCYPPKDN